MEYILDNPGSQRTVKHLRYISIESILSDLHIDYSTFMKNDASVITNCCTSSNYLREAQLV